MEKAKVYFSDLRTSPTSNLLDKPKIRKQSQWQSQLQ